MNNALTILLFVQRKMSLRDIDGLITNTYMFAVIAAIVMLAVAILVASMIQFQSGANPKDRIKRKIWFYLTLLFSKN
jgi:phosphatidylserine synthase